MTPLGNVVDHVPHPRAKAIGTAARAADGETTQFDGVLSGVGADAKGAAAKPATTPPISTADAATAKAASDSPDAASLDALIGKLVTGSSGGTATAKDDTPKRPPGKDRAAVAGPAAGGSGTAAPADTASAMAALLLAGGAMPSASREARGGPAAAPDARPHGAPAGDATPPTDATTVSATTPMVADVAVTTHLAATKAPVDAKAGPDETESADAKTPASPVAPAATSADIGGASPRHDRDPDGSAGQGGASLPDAGTSSPIATGLPSTAPGFAKSLAAAAETAAARTPEPEATKSPVAPAKTLTLQISPTDLGTVDVRMHMAVDGLDVQLTVADQQTLGLLSRERDVLATALQGPATTLHSLVIQDGGAAAQPGGQHASQGHSAGAGQSGGQSAGGDSRGGGQPQRRAPDAAPRNPPARLSSNDSAGGALLV